MNKTNLKLAERLKSIFPNASITDSGNKVKVHQSEFDGKSLAQLYTLKWSEDIIGCSAIRRSGAGVTLTIKKKI